VFGLHFFLPVRYRQKKGQVAGINPYLPLRASFPAKAEKELLQFQKNGSKLDRLKI
jgi:hypothetical protein